VTTRREFLKQSSALAAALGLSAPRLRAQAQAAPAPGGTSKAGRALKILFIGGTDFLGPPTVRRAVERGHVVTLFNRGRTNPHLFPDLEKIQGDRNVEADVRKLAGREWDAVIDTCGYFPRQVRESARVLADNVSQYLFVSTISVYKPLSVKGADESAPLEQLREGLDPETLKTIGPNYGALKALCEEAAEKEMPGQVTVVRPGLIVGPDDDSDRFTYWPVRIAEGGEVLAPGTPEDPVQIIDVRDLGNFMVHCVEKSTVGIMNGTGPQGGMPILAMLDTCKTASKSDARFTFVPEDFLAEQKISGWTDLPCWVSPREPGGALTSVSVDKAVAAGLVFRPAVDTARDTLEWYQKTQKGRALSMGLKRDAEQKALAAWHAKQGTPGAAGGKQ